MRQQFGDQMVFVRGQTQQHIFEINLGIMPVKPGALNQAHDGSRTLARQQEACEQPVFAPYSHGPDLVFCSVIVDWQLLIIPQCQNSCRLRFSAGYPHGKRPFLHGKPHSHHSPEFKEQTLLKARHCGTRSILSIATELNMSPGTHQEMGARLGQGWRTSTRGDKPSTGRPGCLLVAIAAPEGFAGKLRAERPGTGGMVPRAWRL